MNQPASHTERVPTGIEGLDYILGGGLPGQRLCLVSGGPGTGKTTLGFQFLMEGLRRGERALYITLLQSREELSRIAASHGWSLQGLEILELPTEVEETAAAEQTVFTAADVELHEVTDAIVQAIERYRPQRLVMDSITELGVLADNPNRLRRQVLKLKRAVRQTGCTAVFNSASEPEELGATQTLMHGMIDLTTRTPGYGRPRRELEVVKMRAMEFVGGQHDFRIRTGGIEVYPRIDAFPQVTPKEAEFIFSGNKELDVLLGGGLSTGTSCLITGTTGSGKSTLASLYTQAAAEGGEHAAVFCFDERRQTFLRRAEGLGVSMPRYIEEGLIDLHEYSAGDISPSQFAHIVRNAVEQHGAKVVVIDSVSGYLNAMPEQRHLIIQLHDLLSYLGSRGVLTLLVITTHGLYGELKSDIDASYLTDATLLARHFEANGRWRRCLAVIKKRYGDHERTIREFQIEHGGIRVGPPLTEFSGLLTGVPTYHGGREALLKEDQASESKDTDAQ